MQPAVPHHRGGLRFHTTLTARGEGAPTRLESTHSGGDILLLSFSSGHIVASAQCTATAPPPPPRSPPSPFSSQSPSADTNTDCCSSGPFHRPLEAAGTGRSKRLRDKNPCALPISSTMIPETNAGRRRRTYEQRERECDERQTRRYSPRTFRRASARTNGTRRPGRARRRSPAGGGAYVSTRSAPRDCDRRPRGVRGVAGRDIRFRSTDTCFRRRAVSGRTRSMRVDAHPDRVQREPYRGRRASRGGRWLALVSSCSARISPILLRTSARGRA